MNFAALAVGIDSRGNPSSGSEFVASPPDVRIELREIAQSSALEEPAPSPNEADMQRAFAPGPLKATRPAASRSGTIPSGCG